jgi:hypothetical protein
MERFVGRSPDGKSAVGLHVSLPLEWGDILKARHGGRMLLRRSRSQ